MKVRIIKNLLLFVVLLLPVSLFASEISSTNFKIIDSTLGETSYGSWASNGIPLAPGIITSCGRITASGTYILSNNLNGLSGNCISVEGNGALINGGGYTLFGNIISNNHSFTLSNININGDVSVTGTSPSVLVLNNASLISGILNISGTLSGDGSGSVVNALINTGATVLTNSVNFTGNVINNGTIDSSNPVAGKITNNFIINGDFSFNASSTNNGTVNGNVTLSASSTNAGTINGDLTFQNILSTAGVVTFASSTSFSGTNIVSGKIKDYNGVIIIRWIFNDNSVNAGYTKGDSFFNNTARNTGTVQGNAYFNDFSVNAGNVSDNANVYYLVSTPLGGSVGGSIIYHAYPNSPSFGNISGNNSWNNLSNWFTDTTLQIPLGRLPVTGENLVLFASTTLPSNITNNIFIAVSSSTIDGAGHILTGNISGNGAYGGHNAYGFYLANITVNGTTTANGGDGTVNVDGGNGGIIHIATSSTGVVTVNGGDPQQNGGDAGIVIVTNSFAVRDGTPILAIGGDSAGCGYGGSGGNISLLNSSGYVLVTDAGEDATKTIAEGGNCANPPTGFSGSTGSRTAVGVYQAPSTAEVNTNISNNNGESYSLGSQLPNVNMLGLLNLKPIPRFADFDFKDLGTTKLGDLMSGIKQTTSLKLSSTIVFTFSPMLSSFIFESVPKSVNNILNTSPKLAEYLNISKIDSQQNLASIYIAPSLLSSPKDNIPGLFRAVVDGKIQKIYVSSDIKPSIAELIKVKSRKLINISFIPTISGKVTGEFNGRIITFNSGYKNEVTAKILTPDKPGRYLLTTKYSSIPLIVDVSSDVSSVKSTYNMLNSGGLFGWLKDVLNI